MMYPVRHHAQPFESDGLLPRVSSTSWLWCEWLIKIAFFRCTRTLLHKLWYFRLQSKCLQFKIGDVLLHSLLILHLKKAFFLSYRLPNTPLSQTHKTKMANNNIKFVNSKPSMSKKKKKASVTLMTGCKTTGIRRHLKDTPPSWLPSLPLLPSSGLGHSPQS